MSLAATGAKRLTLEPGGSDPMIVCDDADSERAASGASGASGFGNEHGIDALDQCREAKAVVVRRSSRPVAEWGGATPPPHDGT